MSVRLWLNKAGGGFINLKEVEGKICVSSMPYLYDIAKGKIPGHYPLNKFGYNNTLPTSYEDVWDGSAVYTYTTTPVVMHCSSSDATDTQEIEVEGLDGSWHHQVVSQNLAGQTETLIGSADTLWMRVFRVRNLGTTNNAGVVYVYEDDTVTAGVPQTASKIRAQIATGNNQTLMALWTVPSGMTAYLLDFYAGSTATNLVTTGLFFRPYGGVFHIKHLEAFSEKRFEHKFDIPVRILARTDLAIRAKVTIAGGDIFAGFDLWYEND